MRRINCKHVGLRCNYKTQTQQETPKTFPHGITLKIPRFVIPGGNLPVAGCPGASPFQASP
jgi:hypothetical protein